MCRFRGFEKTDSRFSRAQTLFLPENRHRLFAFELQNSGYWFSHQKPLQPGFQPGSKIRCYYRWYDVRAVLPESLSGMVVLFASRHPFQEIEYC